MSITETYVGEYESEYSSLYTTTYQRMFESVYSGGYDSTTYDGTGFATFSYPYTTTYDAADYALSYVVEEYLTTYDSLFSGNYNTDYDNGTFTGPIFSSNYDQGYSQTAYATTYTGAPGGGGGTTPYVADYQGSYSNTFTAQYDADYQGEFAGIYQTGYSQLYVVSDYVTSYTTDFAGQYDVTYDSTYTNDVGGSFDSIYAGVQELYTTATVYQSDTGEQYDSDYTVDYTQTVETPYAVTYESDYATDYTGDFEGQAYESLYNRSYEGSFVQNIFPTVPRPEEVAAAAAIEAAEKTKSSRIKIPLPDKLFTIYLPRPFELQCSPNGNIDFKNILDYFKRIGDLPAQLKLQFFEYRRRIIEFSKEIQEEFAKAIKEIEEFIDKVTGIFPKVFEKLKNWEHEMEYKVREFLKNIEMWLVQRIIRALAKIPFLNAFLKILNLPIPGLAPLRILDYFIDRPAFKKALREKYEKVKAFVKIIDPELIKLFAELGMQYIEYEIEEMYNRIIQWIKNKLNITLIDIVNALWKFLCKIPIIGTIIKALGILLDPTISLEKIFQAYWDMAMAKIKAIRDRIKKIYEGFKKKPGEKGHEAVTDFKKKLIVKLKELADKILDELVDAILNIKIPLFGTVGKVLKINWKEEKKASKVHIKVSIMARIKEAWHDLMDKIRRFFAGGFLKKLYDLILKLPGLILKMFPILRTIIKAISIVVAIIIGGFPICVVMKAIFPQAFDLMKLLYGLLPSFIRVEYAKYGYEGVPVPKLNLSMSEIIEKENVSTKVVPAGKADDLDKQAQAAKDAAVDAAVAEAAAAADAAAAEAAMAMKAATA